MNELHDLLMLRTPALLWAKVHLHVVVVVLVVLVVMVLMIVVLPGWRCLEHGLRKAAIVEGCNVTLPPGLSLVIELTLSRDSRRICGPGLEMFHSSGRSLENN